MDEYWKNKKRVDETKKIDIKFDEFFTIMEDENKKGNTIYRLKFKLTNEIVPNGMTNKQDDIKKLGYRWLRHNEQAANDMIFENTFLTLSPEKIDEIIDKTLKEDPWKFE